jgi:hypothetical protein
MFIVGLSVYIGLTSNHVYLEAAIIADRLGCSLSQLALGIILL